MLADDGSANAREAADTIAGWPMLRGCPVQVVSSPTSRPFQRVSERERDERGCLESGAGGRSGEGPGASRPRGRGAPCRARYGGDGEGALRLRRPGADERGGGRERRPDRGRLALPHRTPEGLARQRLAERRLPRPVLGAGRPRRSGQVGGGDSPKRQRAIDGGHSARGCPPASQCASICSRLRPFVSGTRKYAKSQAPMLMAP